jgi:acyl-coenzyme A synthetase/AMP-(fatty) acid ligase
MLKLNGYRVNAVEVECVLRRCLVSESDVVVVDILGRMREDEEPALSAFVYVAGAVLERGEQVGDVCIQAVSESDAIYPLVQRMKGVVTGSLPTHTMPSAFLQVDRIPRTKSNKTDRRRLHMYGQEFYVNAIRP